MSNWVLFTIIEIVILVVPALLLFKTSKQFFDSMFSYVFRGYYAFWRKKYHYHFMRSQRFGTYFIIVLLATWANLSIFW